MNVRAGNGHRVFLGLCLAELVRSAGLFQLFFLVTSMKKLLLLTLFSLAAFANERTYGWCEQGNQTISVLGYSSSITTPVQRSYAPCTVTVYVTGSESVATANYTSGGTITGTSGQTCSVFFLGGAGAVGTVVLSATNAIATGTSITVNTGRSGFTGPPFSATLGNGTASCSGTAVVTATATGTYATLYSDNSGTPLSNPFTSSATGLYYFYAADGTYDVQLSGAGIPNPFTLGGVSAMDPFCAIGCTGALSRVCSLKTAETISVRDFTPCNGASDDTAGMQTALNDLPRSLAWGAISPAPKIPTF